MLKIKQGILYSPSLKNNIENLNREIKGLKDTFQFEDFILKNKLECSIEWIDDDFCLCYLWTKEDKCPISFINGIETELEYKY